LIQSGIAEMTVDDSNATGGFVAILRDGLSPLEVTIICSAGSFLLAWFTASASNNAGVVALDAYRLMLDGAPIAASGRGVTNAALVGAPIGVAACARVGPVAAGAHTIQVQWKNAALSTCRIRPVSLPELENAQLVVAEVAA